MDQSFFNRILHLVNARPPARRRTIGLVAPALWELWQRASERVQAAQQQRMNHPRSHPTDGAGELWVLVTLLYGRQHGTMPALG